jgi:hypothetical protein
MVARLLDAHVAVGVVGDEDGRLDRQLLRLDRRDEAIEVGVGGVHVAIPGDEDVGGFVGHWAIPRLDPDRRASRHGGRSPDPVGQR